MRKIRQPKCTNLVRKKYGNFHDLIDVGACDVILRLELSRCIKRLIKMRR